MFNTKKKEQTARERTPKPLKKTVRSTPERNSQGEDPQTLKEDIQGGGVGSSSNKQLGRGLENLGSTR